MDKLFPILFGYEVDKLIKAYRKDGCMKLVIAIPWAMIEPHGVQAMNNHSQTLTRLAERGGLAAQEAVAVLEDRKCSWATDPLANDKLGLLLDAWLLRQTKPLNLEKAPGDGT